ncbi:MAG: hypothetical protein NT069_08510, partial [Planctomycetota bacterium]|nr:hypothetical protein [Planctomycetota bacterium]
PQETATAVPVYVPAGQSRVLRLPRTVEQASADRIELRGDDDDFDNLFHVVPPTRRKVSVLYGGDDSEDESQGLRYYLKLATANDILREIDITTFDPDRLLSKTDNSSVPLVVLSRAPTPEQRTTLLNFAENGGVLLLAPVDASGATALPDFLDSVDSVTAAKQAEGGYLLLGEIDFSHPLFAPFAVPPYSDFTKIHFWRSWKLQWKDPPQGSSEASGAGAGGTTVIARFDNGDPALVERRLGSGRVFALASSWRPVDSQFVLSSKFVAFVGSLVDLAVGDVEVSPTLAVHQPAPLPSAFLNQPGIVKTPGGTEVNVAAGSTQFQATDSPGIYESQIGGESSRFAVNLAGSESNTAPLDVEQLEQRGVRLGTALTRAERIDRVRQQRDTELEGRQKLWRWLLVGVLGLVIVETLWASRAERLVEQARVSS